MKPQYHILNGDSLKKQFPSNLLGEIIIARECLVGGSVIGNSLAELFETRANFIAKSYKDFSKQDYFEKTVPEFQKMQNIPDDVDVNLWFEDDLFCQVNLWFVIHLLNKAQKNFHIFLIRPKTHNHFGFGGFHEEELIAMYENRIELTEIDTLGELWSAYQSGELEELKKVSEQLENTYPFIATAVQAHIQRIPVNGNLGRPKESLIKIMNELGTKDFALVFKEFSKRESIYGFGDLQVKSLFDEVLKEDY